MCELFLAVVGIVLWERKGGKKKKKKRKRKEGKGSSAVNCPLYVLLLINFNEVGHFFLKLMPLRDCWVLSQ